MPDKAHRLPAALRGERPQPNYVAEQHKLGQLSLFPNIWYTRDLPRLDDIVFAHQAPPELPPAA